MLYSEIIAVCSQIHTKHINTLCGQNAEFFNVKSRGAYTNHWTLKVNRRYDSIHGKLIYKYSDFMKTGNSVPLT
jgi:hypothetical protein